MKFLTYYPFLILIVLSLACSKQKPQDKADQQKLSVEEWNELNDVPTQEKRERPVKKEINPSLDSLRQVCKLYFNTRDSLMTLRTKYFEEHILSQAKSTTESNREFLSALHKELKMDWDTLRGLPFYERLLLPVFRLDSGRRKMIELPYQTFNLIVDLGIRGYSEESSQVHVFPDVFDSLTNHVNMFFYAFSDERLFNVSLNSVEYHPSECFEHIAMGIENDLLTNDDRIVFMSKFPLELNFQSLSEVDARWSQQYQYHCYDCQFKFEPRVTFATLSGIEGLYFMYADSWPLNTEHDLPHRSLVMDMDGYLVDLWYEEVDLFGCSCL